ncbi:MAG: hypothetical protein DRP18_04025 [Candidatus Aenigmatarchaeota archaeon]|nr:MAG: hypothetical protein DRP18_04025 [Candidatus Aenigmarchaeota archaeon]
MLFDKKTVLLLNILTDKRLRKDLRALRYSRKGYVFFAWKLCKDIKLDNILKTKPHTLEEIIRKLEIKDKRLLECVLDLLVGEGVLSYKNGKYFFRKEPLDFLKSKELRYLQQHYPKSVKWTGILFEKAKQTLLTGKKHSGTSFDDNNFLELWEGIMEESPYSLRKLTIRKFKKYVKPGAEILDLGCGSCVSMEQILLEFPNKKINLTGVDASKLSLRKARERLKKLYHSTKNKQLKENIKNVKLIHHDLRKPLRLNKKYDIIFMSLLVHHFPKKERIKFFQNARNLLKANGKVAIFQIIHISKFKRAPMWVMHAVPTHQEYPFKEEWIKTLSKVFSKVKYWLDGMIVLAEN